jgi:8-oxo-dGTP pyrophosphatase MutT (NUDIX family)
MFSWLSHFIERHPSIHRIALGLWRHFPPRLAGFMKMLLTSKWTVGAVAVIIDESISPMEVLLVEHSYRRKGVWGLPGGALEPDFVSPLKAGDRDDGDVLKSTLRREIYEELGIEIEIGSLIRVDAVPYVPEEPGPYRLDFYYRCLPKCGIGALRQELASNQIYKHSPEIKTIRFVPMSSLAQYDLYSSDKNLLIERWSEISQLLGLNYTPQSSGVVQRQG